MVRKRSWFTHTLEVLALTLACGAVAIPAASAADTSGPLPNPEVKGSLTVHKFEQPSSPRGATDGSELSNSELGGLTPVDGGLFSVTQVKSVSGSTIDLTTSAGWDLLTGLEPNRDALEAQQAIFGPADTQITANGGKAVFEDLALGLYLVEELPSADLGVIAPTAPFFVTIPMPAEQGTWNYDVHAYPKNSIATATKSVEYKDLEGNPARSIGDAVTWTITVDLPYLAVDRDFPDFAVINQLPSQLSLTGQRVIELRQSNGTLIALDPDIDYEFAMDVTTPGAHKVQGELTDAGLAKLKGATGGQLILKIETTVNSIGNGTVTNRASVTIGDATLPLEASLQWGPAQVTKYAKKTDPNDTSLRLPQAQFKMYLSHADAVADRNPIGFLANGQRQYVFESNADGIVSFPGLAPNVEEDVYYVREIAAPPGYELPSNVVNTIHPMAKVTGGTDVPVNIFVANVQHSSDGRLPALGATGALILPILGAGIIALAAGVVISRRRSARS